MKHLTIVCGVALLALASRGYAADEPAPVSDEQFIQKAAAGGMAEVTLGRIASQQAESPDVRKFGERMVTDHTKANMELMMVAAKAQVAVKKELDAKEQEHIDKLKGLKGAEFDRAYMDHMVKDHEKDVAEFAMKARDAKDEQVKAFAAKTLPTLKEHLQMARDICAKVKGKQ